MAELDPRPVEPIVPDETTVVVEPVEVAEQVVIVNRPRKVYHGMWGIPEIAAVAVASLTLMLAVIVYFFWVVPSSRELARNRSEADRLEAEVISAKSKYGEITDSSTQVDKLVASVDDFETRFLPVSTTGQSALYQRLNALIAAYGLVNTSGPDYAPLETVDLNKPQESDEEKGRAKFRSLYPGVYVSTTLEGSYQNLRRFIREIETGRDFVIVSTVELAPSDTEKQTHPTVSSPNEPYARPVTNPIGPQPNMQGFPMTPNPVPVQGGPQPRRQQGKTHGETVSLHIELAAYFRRPNFAPQTAQ